MTALSADKDVQERQSAFSQLVGDAGSGTPNASSVFYKGALVCYDTSDNTIKPGATSTTHIALGRCEQSAAAGEAEELRIRSGIFKFENEGSSIDNGDVGSLCYVTDDQTVNISATGRSVAGRVYKVESDGVWVAVNPLV